jgi:myosin heavy subunit
VEQQVKELTDRLTGETRLREEAQEQVETAGRQRGKLEQELVKNQQTLDELRSQLRVEQENYAGEQNRLAARTRELEERASDLAEVRSKLEEESSRCRKLADLIASSDHANTQLTTEVRAARDLITRHENSIQSLERQFQDRQAEIERLGSLLQSETAHNHTQQSLVQRLEKLTGELTSQLSRKVREQQEWQQRESELQSLMRRQKDQLAASAAAAVIQEAELKNLKAELEEQRVLRSVLCARVRELTAQNDTAIRRITDLEGDSEMAAQTLQSRDQELASLRHAILDAARFGAKVNHERLQSESQLVDGWRRLLTTLFHTPLSTAQRGLVAEINGALTGWDNRRSVAATSIESQVEPPNLHRSEFNCSEVIESAIASVEERAGQSRAKGRTSLVGAVPESAYGNAAQIHQLITLLAAWLPDAVAADRFTMDISVEKKPAGNAEMLLQLLLSSNDSDENMVRRLTAIVAASGKLRVAGSVESELAVASAWQLSLAMGGRHTIETTATGELNVHICLPLGSIAPLLSVRQSGRALVGASSSAANGSDPRSARTEDVELGRDGEARESTAIGAA